MRHREMSQSNDQSDIVFGIKEEDIDELAQNVDLKVEIPDNIFDECESLKEEFINSNVEYALDNVLDFDINADRELPELFELSRLQKAKKKNKRKSHPPQKAKQREDFKESTDGHSTNDNDELFSVGYNGDQLSDSMLNSELFNSNSDLPEGDDIFNHIDEHSIFQEIQEEKDDVGDQMVDDVKEEFRNHCGIKCNMCEKVFPFKVDFDTHYTTCYNMTPVYTCAFCNKTVEKYSTFRSHCYRHVTEGRYKCSACPKAFCLQSLLQVHMVSKHSKTKPFSCDECDKSFLTQAGLKMHVRKHKSEVKEDYPCVMCGKVLHTRGGLTSHMNVHRLGRRFMCDVCGKTFTQKVNMQQHARHHTGDKPHKCEQCGKMFAEKSHLARHFSFHSDQRPFKCEICNKMYKTERCLKVHSMVHAEERPFVCTYCNKGFLSSTKLKQHSNTHTGERPYACKYCERTFTNYPNWLKHVRRRHKVDHKTGENLEPKKEESQKTVPSNNSVELVEPQQVSSSMAPSATVAAPALISSSLSIVPPPPTLEELPSMVTTADISSELSSDLMLTRTEEFLLQQSLLQYPIIDDKYLYHPQVDVYNGNFIVNSSSPMGVTMVPYFQTSLQSPPNTTNGIPPLSLHMNDIVTQVLQQQQLASDGIN